MRHPFAIRRAPRGFVLEAPGHPPTTYRRRRDALSYGLERCHPRLRDTYDEELR